MTPAEAEVAARRQFGNVATLREDLRDMQTLPSAERLWRALRYGSRQLRSSPLFTAILSFSTGVAVATVFLCGLLPALQATRVDLVSALKASTAAAGTATGSVRLRRVLVAVQIGLSVLLLVGAGLFAKTLINLERTDTGLHAIADIVTFQIDPAKNGYTAPRLNRFYGDLLVKVITLPGVETAAYAWIPVLETGAPEWATSVQGYVPSAGENMEIAGNVVSPGFWRTMGVPLIDGRDFNEGDRFTAPQPGQLPTVAIVNRAFARRFFGSRTAVGGRFGIGDDKPMP